MCHPCSIAGRIFKKTARARCRPQASPAGASASRVVPEAVTAAGISVVSPLACWGRLTPTCLFSERHGCHPPSPCMEKAFAFGARPRTRCVHAKAVGHPWGSFSFYLSIDPVPTPKTLTFVPGVLAAAPKTADSATSFPKAGFPFLRPLMPAQNTEGCVAFFLLTL